MKKIIALIGAPTIFFTSTTYAAETWKGLFTTRLMKLMGAANVSFTKEQMLGLNAQLNRIKRNFFIFC